MAEKTNIEWTASADGTPGSSWNPIRARYNEIQSDGSGKERIGWHCTHASDGCRFCYAEAFNRRLGTGRDYKPDELYREDREGRRNGEVRVFLDEKMLMAPLHWKKSRKIFVCSMTDLFADFVTDEWLDQIFAIMALCPNHTFIVLTKRSARMRQYAAVRNSRNEVEIAAEKIRKGKHPSFGGKHLFQWPLPNVWMMVSVEDQKNANARIPDLLATPAAVRGVSMEPMLGPVDLASIDVDGHHEVLPLGAAWLGRLPPGEPEGPRLDWVICGNESGRNRRPGNLDDMRAVRDQCAAAGVAWFGKQDDKVRELPDDLKVRQFPKPDRRDEVRV